MQKSHRFFLALFLGLILCVCLLPAACADGLSDLEIAINSGAESYTLTENTTIPAETEIFALGIKLIVPENKTLTVNGTLLAGKLYDNGTVIVGENGFLYVEKEFHVEFNDIHGVLELSGELSMEHDAFSPEELVWQQNFIQNPGSLLDVSFNVVTEEQMRNIMFDGTPVWGSGFCRSFWMCAPWTLSADLELPPETRLCIPYGRGYDGSLLIPAGKTLTIPEGSKLYARGAGPADQQAVVEVRGALVNNGSIELDWGDTLADIALAGNGSYSGTGTVMRNGVPYDLAAEHAAFAAFVAACGQNYTELTEYDIDGSHVFTIRDELTIPENLSVFAIDSTFEVAFPASFTIQNGGELIAGGLESFGNTAVYGSLHLENGLRILDNKVSLQGDMVITIDAWLSLWEFVGAENPEDLAAKFNFGPNSLLDIWVEPPEEDVSASLDFEMFHIPHIRETYCLTYPWTLDHDRVLQLDTRLLFHYGGGATGMLIIPEGKTLTIPQGSEILARGATENGAAIVQINGTLVNKGTFILHRTRAGLADVALGSKGIYCGNGSVTRVNEPYEILNSKTSADIVLPEDLTTLDAQAIADGTYGSVYIPAGATQIASDAFGGKTELIILGVSGSNAESFADSKDFLFGPVGAGA